MPLSLIALGSNLGDRGAALTRAVELLGKYEHVAVLARSGFHETPPIGGAPGQGSFLNAAVLVDTTLSPAALQTLLHQTEASLGRTRNERWAARRIDLDLLLYDDVAIATPELSVPHPRMAFRRFVLAPAAEIAPGMIHPTIGWSVGQLLSHLDSAIPYVALLGLPGSGKTGLAERLTGIFPGRLVADPGTAANPPEHPNQPSRVARREIQFLDARGTVLDRGRWPNVGVLAVSDFYFDQSLAYAALEDEADAIEDVRASWERAYERVVQPKLLVVLDDPAIAVSEGKSHRLRVELLALAARAGIGPVLYAGAVDREAQFKEISAAVLAMQ